MPTNTINGISYPFPAEGDLNWGTNVSDWATAVSQHLLQKTGGVFTLSADVDFGSSKGLSAPYYKSKGTNISSAGALRLANTESVGWRNATPASADVLLSVNASNELTFNGGVIATSVGLVPIASGGTAISTYATGDTLYASAANTLAKLTIGTARRVSAVNAAGTLPEWTFLLDAHIDAAAALARTKLASGTNYRILANSSTGVMSENAAITASRAVVSDANGQLVASAATATELSYVSGVTSAIQTQLNAKASSTVYAWSGYHANDSAWARTSTAFGDPAADATSTFTEVANTNFGVVTSAVSGADKLPGIVFTPAVTGFYFITAVASVQGPATVSVGLSLRLTDGTTTVAEGQRQTESNGQNISAITVSGLYNVSALTATTLKIQTRADSGAVTLVSPSTIRGSIEWSIFKI